MVLDIREVDHVDLRRSCPQDITSGSPQTKPHFLTDEIFIYNIRIFQFLCITGNNPRADDIIEEEEGEEGKTWILRPLLTIVALVLPECIASWMMVDDGAEASYPGRTHTETG